ncbi:glycosyltransferase [Ectopseudomonas mendocina]|uniref:glycosyltransferase n=1 Tax=Ectopseudomonas mendocina TaxID=300 RepID=UPI001ADFCC1A|nr:glycosyltransferase [Pseudomonas mendocina]QTN45225.1 glycosyltransferase [Pseudomonas mendocina]
MPDQDISKQLEKLRNAFRKELRESVNDIRLDALYQQLLMQHVFKQPEPLAAMTTWSIAPEFAWWLYQHVTAASPDTIIELGSGTSTLVIAAALKQVGKGKFLSFEHDHAYYEKTLALLQACGLQGHVELLYAPLERLELDGDIYRWYDLPYDLIDHMIGREKLDLLLVDGPPAATNRHARYPALLRLRDYFSDSTVVLLDDAGREEEQEILARWSELSGSDGAHQMLSNIRHGPALFYPSKKSVSLNVREDISMETVSELVGQEVEQLVESVVGQLSQEAGEELVRPLLDAFYRLRERSVLQLKLKYAAASEQCQSLEQQRSTLQAELSDAIALRKQSHAEHRAASAQLEGMATERQALITKTEALEAELAGLRSAQTELEQGSAQMQSVIAALETLRGEQLGSIESIKQELADTLARAERAEQSLEQDTSELQASFIALKAEYDAQLQVVDQLRIELVDTVARAERAERSLEQNTSDMHASYASLQAKYNAQLKMVDQLQIELVDMQARIERSGVRENLALEKLQKLQEKVDSSNAELDAAKARELDLEFRLKRIQTREVTLLEELEATEKRVASSAQASVEFAIGSLRAQLDSARRANGKMTLKLKAAEKDLGTANRERNALKKELSALSKRYKQVYKSLVYQLGLAFYRQTRSTLSWAKMPLAIHRVMRRHAASGNPEVVDYQEPLMPRLNELGHVKTVKNTEVTECFDIKKCSTDLQQAINKFSSKDALWVASQVAEEQGYQAAVQFAEQKVHENQRLGVSLLRANADLHSEENWLRHFNAYLNPLELAPVSLSETTGTRFSRLYVKESLSPVDGPLVSVIMPAFNAEATLKHAAQSILSQTWRNLQLIIVDDCSSDATWEIAQQIAAQDHRVLALRNAVNVGPYVSKNLALRLAKGDYITGQDADDWSHPQRLERDFSLILSSNGQVLATLSEMIRMNPNGEFSWFSRIGPFSRNGSSRVAAISLLIDAVYLKDILGGWDSVRFGADSELISRAEKVMGNKFRRVSNIGMFCLDLETSLTSSPEFGVSKTNGVSPTRKRYKEAFLHWHARLDGAEAYLPFPHFDRKFAAPYVMLVPPESIEKNIDFHRSLIGY